MFHWTETKPFERPVRRSGLKKNVEARPRPHLEGRARSRTEKAEEGGSDGKGSRRTDRLVSSREVSPRSRGEGPGSFSQQVGVSVFCLGAKETRVGKIETLLVKKEPESSGDSGMRVRSLKRENSKTVRWA